MWYTKDLHHKKDGKNYLRDRGLNVEDIKEWHIGGSSAEVVSRVQNLLSNPWPFFDEIRQEAVLN